MLHSGGTLIRTRLSHNILTAEAEAHWYERKLAKSRRTAKYSTAPVTLAWQKQAVEQPRYEPPKLRSDGVSIAVLRGELLKAEEAGDYVFLRWAVACRLLEAGLINEDPRHPESCKYHITRAGLAHCAWLKSRKN